MRNNDATVNGYEINSEYVDVVRKLAREPADMPAVSHIKYIVVASCTVTAFIRIRQMSTEICNMKTTKLEYG